MARLKEHLSDREIFNLTFIICTWQLHGLMCKALRLEYDDMPERIVEIPVPGDDRPGGEHERLLCARQQSPCPVLGRPLTD
jgi:hypothetical protein